MPNFLGWYDSKNNGNKSRFSDEHTVLRTKLAHFFSTHKHQSHLLKPSRVSSSVWEHRDTAPGMELWRVPHFPGLYCMCTYWFLLLNFLERPNTNIGLAWEKCLKKPSETRSHRAPPPQEEDTVSTTNTNYGIISHKNCIKQRQELHALLSIPHLWNQ